MAKRYRKKRKLKKWVRLFFGILSLSIILSLFFIMSTKRKEENDNKSINNISQDKIISNILSYNIDKEIDANFLKWISKNYGKDSINNLNNYLRTNNYDKSIWHDTTGNSLIVLKDLYSDLYSNMNNIKIIKNTGNVVSLDFIGDVSLADNWYIAPKYDERGKKIYGILGKEIVDELVNADLSIANNEFTVSDRGAKIPGKTYTFRASPSRLPIYNEMGIDLVTLANNHVYDFGKDAFMDMLDAFDKYDIPHIGAGKNINEAGRPYYFILNGYKVAFVNANRSEKNIKTPGATDTEPGVFRCYDATNFTNLIKETKKNSDIVIALVHWGAEDSHELEEVQIETSKIYIDAGADLIVGGHAHVLQGIDFYKDKAIIYNLGDFIFNNEDKDTMIFKFTIDNNAKFKYYIIPAHQKNEFTDILKDKDRVQVFNNIVKYSDNKINIDENGEIYKK